MLNCIVAIPWQHNFRMSWRCTHYRANVPNGSSKRLTVSMKRNHIILVYLQRWLQLVDAILVLFDWTPCSDVQSWSQFTTCNVPQSPKIHLSICRLIKTYRDIHENTDNRKCRYRYKDAQMQTYRKDTTRSQKWWIIPIKTNKLTTMGSRSINPYILEWLNM